jgi:CxxC motif-containing protein (DUF1111 family)
MSITHLSRKISLAVRIALLLPACAFAATDPGVRGGAAGGGQPLPGLSQNQLTFFDASKDVFEEVDAVADGLGPRFNLDGCSGCHSQPAIGGSAPSVNPQVTVANKAGADNIIPSFITANGPIREARFVSDGGVHQLFTIAGRNDAPNCALTQPDFATELANNNVRFRIPTPTFGLGLVEAISDDAIRTNRDSVTAANPGITGKVNRNGNDGTITRFGWKAQNKSLLLFSGEAYNVEVGVTNELFQNEVNTKTGCATNGIPESPTNFDETVNTGVISDIEGFSIFMRFLAAPTPSTTVPGGAASISAGRTLFTQIGCALCHTPSFPTQASSVAALSGKTANLFSDLLVHNMGPGLADGISQGLAAGDEFRTAPLWGLGQRVFFLHDGRTRDVQTAILAHRSAAAGGVAASEANAVINNFSALPDASKQNLINFLRSL